MTIIPLWQPLSGHELNILFNNAAGLPLIGSLFSWIMFATQTQLLRPISTSKYSTSFDWFMLARCRMVTFWSGPRRASTDVTPSENVHFHHGHLDMCPRCTSCTRASVSCGVVKTPHVLYSVLCNGRAYHNSNIWYLSRLRVTLNLIVTESPTVIVTEGADGGSPTAKTSCRSLRCGPYRDYVKLVLYLCTSLTPRSDRLNCQPTHLEKGSWLPLLSCRRLLRSRRRGLRTKLLSKLQLLIWLRGWYL